MRHSARLALVVPMLALGGCAVGFVRVSTPERLPADSVPPLAQTLSFDVCVPPRSPPATAPQIDRERKALAGRVREALSRAGVDAELVEPPGTPARFTVTQPLVEGRHAWSLLASLLSASAIPGYGMERRALEVDVAGRDPARGDRPERLRYEARVRYFSWLPFVVHPDFFASVNGGWLSAEAKDAGFDGTVARLADDLRVRHGGAGTEAPPGDAAGVTCPSEVAGSEPWQTMPARRPPGRRKGR